MLTVIAFVIGASVGSFLNVVADRTVEGGSLVSPRSHCPSCKRPLPNVEMVPIFSYLWLRGRCKECDARIPVRVLLVELATAILFTAAYLKHGLGPGFVVVSAGASLLLVIAVIDLEHSLILDRIALPAILALLLLSPFWTELGLDRPFLGSSDMLASTGNSLTAGAGAFLLFLVILLTYPPGMGGGDVKLAGLLGLLVGLPEIFVALWIGAVAGGSVAIALLLLRRKGRKDAIPFGPYLSLGGIAALLAGSELISAYQDLVDSIAGV